MSTIKQACLRAIHPLCLALCLFTLSLLTLSSAASGFSAQPSDKQSTELATLRRAGLQGDRSQIATLINNLTAPAHRAYVQTSLHALAQLGATEALPAIDKVCRDTSDRDNQGYARVARARLIAESGALGSVEGKVEASAKMSRFYQELALTPAELNTGLSHNQSASYQPQPMEVYAVREIADMVYRGSYADYAALPGVAQVDFHADAPAALKMRLSAIVPERRLGTMIQELSQKKTLMMDDNFEIQLAAHECHFQRRPPGDGRCHGGQVPAGAEASAAKSAFAAGIKTYYGSPLQNAEGFSHLSRACQEQDCVLRWNVRSVTTEV